MKQIIYRLSALLFTFFIGIIAAWLIFLLTIVSQPIEIQPVSINHYSSEIPITPIPKVSNEKPRFVGTWRGCGFGYDQGYETDDGQQLSEGMDGFATRKKARAEFNKRIAKTVQIIERGQKFRNHPGKVGERVVLINPSDKNGKETISILWFDGGQFIAFIDAPTLDLALEFEQFLEKTEYLGDPISY